MEVLDENHLKRGQKMKETENSPRDKLGRRDM